MAGGQLTGLVTFSSNGERNRAANAIQNWVTNWNSTHPGEQFTGSTSNLFYLYPPDDEVRPGVNARALSVDYTCTSYAGIEDAQEAIIADVNANAYWDIISMGTRLI